VQQQEQQAGVSAAQGKKVGGRLRCYSTAGWFINESTRLLCVHRLLLRWCANAAAPFSLACTALLSCEMRGAGGGQLLAACRAEPPSAKTLCCQPL
jgi:hypothetical protein